MTLLEQMNRTPSLDPVRQSAAHLQQALQVKYFLGTTGLSQATDLRPSMIGRIAPLPTIDSTSTKNLHPSYIPRDWSWDNLSLLESVVASVNHSKIRESACQYLT